MWSATTTPKAVSTRTSGQSVSVDGTRVTVWFEPASKEGTDEGLVQALSGATKVRIMSFLISDPETLKALRPFAPKSRDIRGIYDHQGMLDALGHTKDGKRKSPDPVLDWWLKDRRFVEVRSHPFGQAGGGGESDFMHNKAMILDDRYVITGSYNFSENAEANGENMLMFDSSGVARAYVRYFDAMYGHYRRTGGA